MDELSSLFSQFTPSAKLVFSGDLCEISSFTQSSGLGYIHLLRSGSLTISRKNADALIVNKPSVVFYPRPCDHKLEPQGDSKIELLCASVDPGRKATNPLTAALPEILVIPIEDAPTIVTTLDLMFSEAFIEGCGHKVAVDRLMEYFLVLLLRYVINEKGVEGGLLAGLGDHRLSKAITAMHQRPSFPWTVEELAVEAGMSRARFALKFSEIVKKTPMEYLTDWRIYIAQTLLKKGRAIKVISLVVGYQSPSAMTRVFVKKLGMTPREWIKEINTSGK